MLALTHAAFLGSFSVMMSGAIPISTFHVTSSAANSGGSGVLSGHSHAPSTYTPRVSIRSHVLDVAGASHDQETGTIAYVPRYTVVLLVLFIVVCGISSGVVIALFYSRSGQERIRKMAKRIWGPPAKVRLTGEKNVEHDEGDNSKREERVLDINQITRSHPVLTGNGDAPKTRSTTAPGVEQVDGSLTLSTGEAPDSKNGKSVTYERSPDASKDLDSSRASPSPEPLHVLVSASTKALQRLSSIISLPDDNLDVIPSGETSVVQAEHSPKIVTVSPFITIKNSISLKDDDSAHTGNSQDSTSSTAFCSLADVLSPSTAVYSLVNLAAFTANQEFDLATIPGPLEVFGERDLTDGFSPSRYVPGSQLETIQEESGSLSLTSQSALTPVNSIIHNTSRKSLRESIEDFDALVHSNSGLNQGTACARFEATPDDSLRSVNASLTERIPSTWEKLGLDLQDLSLSRSLPFSAACPPPLPSEPTSAVVPVPTLQSPYRTERCQTHSVAWLSPIIECSVDGQRANLDEPETEGEDECEYALHSANALAAVMDSVAAIGLDPTNMGLLAEDTPPSFSASDPFPDSPLVIGTLIFNDGVQLQTATADSVEEDEAEREIGSQSDLTSSTAIPLAEDKARKEGDVNVLDSSPFISSQMKSVPTKLGEGVARTHESVGSVFESDNSASGASFQKSFGSLVEQYPKASGKRSKSNPSNTTGCVGSPTSSQTLRTPRGVKLDRVYPSPSSLAGLSPAEASKRFSIESASSIRSTPPEKRPSSPQHHFSPVSPLTHARKAKAASFSPTLRDTPSTTASSPRSGSESPPPCNQSPLFYGWHTAASPHTPRATASPRRSTSSTRPLSPRKNLHQSNSSPVFLPQRPKPPAISQLARSPSVLQEKSNSMEFV